MLVEEHLEVSDVSLPGTQKHTHTQAHKATVTAEAKGVSSNISLKRLGFFLQEAFAAVYLIASGHHPGYANSDPLRNAGPRFQCEVGVWERGCEGGALLRKH